MKSIGRGIFPLVAVLLLGIAATAYANCENGGRTTSATAGRIIASIPNGSFAKEASGASIQQDKVHTPAPGTPERKAIMDALRGDQKVVFKVYYLKVHNGWAWADTTPLDEKGKAVAEGGPSLLHKDNGVWKVMDLSVIPEDPDDPLADQDASPRFVKEVLKAFPGCPADIFPKSK